MRTVGLFAGIGGVELGLKRSGHDAELLCEIWKPARAVLSAHFPDCELAEDVRGLRSLPRATELLVAGFPCQDLSQAGMTAGIGGQRSGLVDHVFRLLDRQRAPWVLLENVSFMLQLDRGKAMERLTHAFEERGYRWCYRVVNSLGFLPQRRERVYFLATRADADVNDVLLADEATAPATRTEFEKWAHGFYWTEGIRGLGWAVNAVPTLKNGSTVGIPSPPAIVMPDGAVITPDIRDAESLQGFDPDWTAPAIEVGRASFRWSLVGNAVTVPVAEWVGRRLAEPGVFDASRSRKFPETGRWPRAACFDGAKRHAVEISDFPVWRERKPLHQFLHFPGTPLSARATKGFLSRAEVSSLRFPEGFLDRLRVHLKRMEDAPASISRRRSVGDQAKAA